MNKVASLLFVAVTAAGCGGPELLIDTTPPVLIPNGGSAQAGQVDGPTAIPLTGAGAIVVDAVPASAEPAPPPLSVIDAAAIEATGAPAPEAGDDEATDGGDDPEGDADPSALRDSDEEGDVGAVAPLAPPAPIVMAARAPVVETAKPQVAPSTRTVDAPGYALAIPAAWEDLDPAGLGSIFIVSANRSMDAGDGFYTNVIVSSEPWAGDTQSYAVSSLSPIVEGGARIVGADNVPPTRAHRGHVDVEAYWINVTGTPYVTVQRYLTTGQVGFVVTCAAAASAFDDHRDACLDIIDSFQVDSGS